MATASRRCRNKLCRRVFQARIAEINRGNAHYCSRSCSAVSGNSKRPIGTSPAATRKRARAIYITRHGLPVCRKCRCKQADVHHKDGNEFNNDDSNHDPLCRSCHVALENHLHPKRKKRVYEFLC